MQCRFKLQNIVEILDFLFQVKLFFQSGIFDSRIMDMRMKFGQHVNYHYFEYHVRKRYFFHAFQTVFANYKVSKGPLNFKIQKWIKKLEDWEWILVKNNLKNCEKLSWIRIPVGFAIPYPMKRRIGGHCVVGRYWVKIIYSILAMLFTINYQHSNYSLFFNCETMSITDLNKNS